MKCLVVTPERTEVDVEAALVVLPLFDGEYGVMPGHTPVVGRMGAGELRIKQPDGKILQFYVEGGFVELLGDVVAVLTMFAIPADKMDVERAEKLLEDALQRPYNTPELAQIREERLVSCRARLRMAQRVAGQ